jgi:hypothetical protein
VGCGCFEGEAALEILNELYGWLRLWVNFFCPQQKLVSNTRLGARVTTRYEEARTRFSGCWSQTGYRSRSKTSSSLGIGISTPWR